MFVICFDTICTGYEPVMTESPEGERTPMTFDTEAEAEAELKDDPEFYEDCFVCPITEIGHKTIYTGKEN